MAKVRFIFGREMTEDQMVDSILRIIGKRKSKISKR